MTPVTKSDQAINSLKKSIKWLVTIKIAYKFSSGLVFREKFYKLVKRKESMNF